MTVRGSWIVSKVFPSQKDFCRFLIQILEVLLYGQVHSQFSLCLFFVYVHNIDSVQFFGVIIAFEDGSLSEGLYSAFPKNINMKRFEDYVVLLVEALYSLREGS